MAGFGVLLATQVTELQCIVCACILCFGFTYGCFTENVTLLDGVSSILMFVFICFIFTTYNMHAVDKSLGSFIIFLNTYVMRNT